MNNRNGTTWERCPVKRLPNLVSCFRIVLSIAFLFLRDKPALFAVAYSLCGISDVADGYLARLLNAETTIGAKLDSMGDFFFYAAWLFILLTFAGNDDFGPIIIFVIAIAVIRVTNLAITKAKFKQWNVMHTIGNKLTGFILFLILPFYVFVDDVISWSIIAVGIIAVLSSLEENVILLKSKSYNADRRSIFSR